MTRPRPRGRVMIIHGVTAADPALDDADTLVQANAIGAALRAVGYAVDELPLGLDLRPLEQLQDDGALTVFNLVESLAGRGALLHLPVTVLETLGMPYTGANARSLLLTTDKPTCKQLLRAATLPTPDWWQDGLPPADALLIVKPSHEDSSCGITAASVMTGADYRQQAQDAPAARALFAEAYIEGREFNVSLLEGAAAQPRCLPVAEIRFIDFPPARPRILDYEAKWALDSAAYRGTVRHTLAAAEEPALQARLAALAEAVWLLFGLRGYARVDFRVDANGQPWIIDVNANPCLSPDAGFMAAAGVAGLSFGDVILQIVKRATATKD